MYELKTKLGTAMAIEKEFKIPIMKIFGMLGEATTDELIKITEHAAGKITDKTFRQALVEEYDYIDLLEVVQNLVARLMFAGSPEQNEAKMQRMEMPETQKNVLRRLLEMPDPRPPLTSES